MTCEELHEVVKKLDALLDDPHPGLYTWNKAVKNKIREISKYNHINFSPITKGHHITREKFINWVQKGYVTNDDGFGRLATKTHETDLSIFPSDIEYDPNFGDDYSHVVWYNK